MKHIYLFLALVALLSCKTNNLNSNETINFRVWHIKAYSREDESMLPSIISEGYLIYNLKTEKTYMHLILSEALTKELESQWKRGNKKLILNQVNMVQELQYSREDSKLIIEKTKSDYVLKGEHTDPITEKINNIIYTERAGESAGVFTLLYRIWNPDIVRQIPLPPLIENDTFELKFSKGYLELHNTRDNTIIILEDNGIHEWIGY